MITPDQQLHWVGSYEVGKRLFDVVAAGTGLALLVPLMVIVAVLVKIGSKGPIFYRGARTGRLGHPFRILKFRTMVAGAEAQGGTTTAKGDPRLTRVGKIIRKYKIDEIPQLINVLKGDMSIVGPRPEVEEYTRLYTPEEKEILNVKPGITDYASLEFLDLQEIVGTTDVDRVYSERIRPVKNALRLRYVRERGFVCDMAILFKTVARLAHLRGKAKSPLGNSEE